MHVTAEGRARHRWGALVSWAIDKSVTTSLKSAKTRAFLEFKRYKLPQFF